MPAFPRLSDSAIASVELFLRTFHVDYGARSNAELFTIFCSGCHGAAGEDTTRGLEIRNPKADYATFVIRNGRPGAPGFRDSMTTYVRGLK